MHSSILPHLLAFSLSGSNACSIPLVPIPGALKEIHSAIREQKYAPVVAILMGAAVMQVLLSGSGSGTG